MEESQTKHGMDTDTLNGQLWITEWIERGKRRVKSYAGASALLFGLPPSVVLIAYLGLRWQYMTPSYLFSFAAVFLILLVAPYLIWYYEAKLLPTFRDDVTGIVASSDRNRAQSLVDRYSSLIDRYWWMTAILASTPIPILMARGGPFLREYGLFGVTDPLFWAVFVVLLWIGAIVGIGFLLVVVTVLIIRNIASLELRIDPMYPDGLGGMSIIGRYAIRTTGLFSIGSLLIPLQLQYAAVVGPPAGSLIYVMGSLYAVFIGLSFLYPTIRISQRANEIRQRILENIRDQYEELKRTAGEPRAGADLADTDPVTEQKLTRLRNEYQTYQQVRLYPLRVSIIARLIGSIILPLLLMTIEFFLQTRIMG